jgi:hypothetical protein
MRIMDKSFVRGNLLGRIIIFVGETIGDYRNKKGVREWLKSRKT